VRHSNRLSIRYFQEKNKTGLRYFPYQEILYKQVQSRISRMSGDPGQLRREVSALHRAAFGREVPEKVAQRYAEAHRIALLQVDITQARWMQRALEEGTDLEALEFALRAREPDHVLCRKLKLLIYITEAFPEYYSDFVNEAPRRLNAFIRLALHSLRSLYKQLKARLLLRSFV